MHPVLRTVLQRLGLGMVTLLAVSVIIFSSLEIAAGRLRREHSGPGRHAGNRGRLQQRTRPRPPRHRPLFRMDRQRAAGRFRLLPIRALSGTIKRDVSTDHRAAPLQHLLPGRHGGHHRRAAVALPGRHGGALPQFSWFDRIVNSVTLTTIAMPEFFVAYILMFFFAIKLRWFYPLSTVSVGHPVSRASLPRGAARHHHDPRHRRPHDAHDQGRDHQPAGQPLYRNGAAQGRSEIAMSSCTTRLPNAWAPIATVIAFNLAYLVVGVVVVEVVFVYPGIGQLMVDAVSSRDMPVVQACALIFAATYILLNLSGRHRLDRHQSTTVASKMNTATPPISASSRPAAPSSRISGAT